MRRKIFTLMTLMLAVCSGAWADAVPGEANSNYLDIAKYQTINLENTYAFTEDAPNNVSVLAASAARLRANKATQTWIADAANGSAKQTWSASGYFQGSDFYNFGTSNNVVTVRSGKSISFKVTNCTKVSAIVNSQSSSRTIYMYVYQLNADGTARSSETPVDTKSSATGSQATLTSGTLTASNIYEINVVSSDASNNSSIYEIAFYTPFVGSAEPTGTTVSPTSTTLAVGKTIQLTGTFSGGVFTGQWVSDNTSIATVNSSGLVTGVAAGTAHITYQWTEDQSEEAYKATATITVLPGFTASDYDLYNVYDFTSMGNVAFTLNGSSAGNIWNQANSRNMAVYYCTNEGLENLAVQQAYGEDSGDSKTYMRGWKIVSGSGLFEGNGAGRCAAIGGIKSGQIVEFNHTSGNNFYTKNDGSDAGIRKTLLWAESGHHVFRADEDGMVGFELDKNNYVTSINIYTTATTTPPSMTESGSVTWDFSSAAAQTAAGTISVGSNTLLATDGTSEIIYYTNNSNCKWNNDGNGYYLYGSGKTSNSNGRFFILQIASNGTLSLTTTGNNGKYTIKKCATASTSWNDGTDLTTITTSANGVPVSGDIVYDAEKPYLLIGFPDDKLNTQKIVWKSTDVYLTTSDNMAGWRAFYDADNGYTLDSNTKAYIATEQDGDAIKLKALERGIPAATPVILNTSSSADSHKMTLTKASVTAYNAGTDGANLLQYTTSAVTDKYRLGFGGNGVGFYPYTGVPTSGAVILNVSSASARALSIVFDEEETGIKKIENATSDKENGAYFNLAGQRVAQPTKGLYIVNGKKVVIK